MASLHNAVMSALKDGWVQQDFAGLKGKLLTLSQYVLTVQKGRAAHKYEGEAIPENKRYCPCFPVQDIKTKSDIDNLVPGDLVKVDAKPRLYRIRDEFKVGFVLDL
ncbi:hypothetical protein MP228_005524 [Amoeboaphelidium protococcarum]|nr:hypothetical protein MP228_005524 [Amoeboaphelidium protococcarum]